VVPAGPTPKLLISRSFHIYQNPFPWIIFPGSFPNGRIPSPGRHSLTRVFHIFDWLDPCKTFSHLSHNATGDLDSSQLRKKNFERSFTTPPCCFAIQTVLCLQGLQCLRGQGCLCLWAVATGIAKHCLVYTIPHPDLLGGSPRLGMVITI
jgi:hypothetical protein